MRLNSVNEIPTGIIRLLKSAHELLLRRRFEPRSREPESRITHSSFRRIS